MNQSPVSSSCRWSSPNPQQKASPKQFVITWTHDLDMARLLDRVSGSLRLMNGGRLWRFNDEGPLHRPDVSEGTLELTAWASYTGAAGQPGSIQLEIVAQLSIDGRQIGLFLTFTDAHDPMEWPWKHQVAETIVAHTILHVHDSLYFQVTGQQYTDIACNRWTMTMGAWRSGAVFQYGSWWVELG